MQAVSASKPLAACKVYSKKGDSSVNTGDRLFCLWLISDEIDRKARATLILSFVQDRPMPMGYAPLHPSDIPFQT